ncbi:rhomboid family protein [Arthrospiribacter ruber]|uniref:Rhomboid family intramembrane serine protease n=1 Tax=Arthrospiribacter ruber TaxID=2487934 RepID=A0A951IXJ4_9BACT|nr:rhomboid family intramembrane serine protease [Arthrospiribacter ruber]MBW3469005.1 rhomboid family intramembrane serine protease [Arthrospiribacter ruber]
MYGGFWDNLRNAFKHSNNSLFKLLAINILVFFVMAVFRVLFLFSGAGELYQSFRALLMMPADLNAYIIQPWSLLTYMFFHEGIFHILFNMLFLYWFGLLVHEYLGSRKLTNLYILGGIAGAVLYVVMYNISPYFSDVLANSRMLGASAGVYAIVVGAATLAPNTSFHLLLLGPVKIKYIAIFYVIIAFVNSAGSNAGGELAHLGGAAMGFLYIKQLQKGKDWGIPIQAIGIFFEKLFDKKPKVKVSYRKKKTFTASQSYTASDNPKPTPSVKTGEPTQEEIDKILDKIAERGYEALSKEEKRKLFEFSKK